MYFQIQEIILWPRREGFAPRRVKLRGGVVNVISGGSRTGKSAVIPIIDYCLGASLCAIPVNTIRDACSWFGVIVATEQGEKLFARREPGDQKVTDDMFVAEGTPVPIPDLIRQRNTSADAVRRTLDEMAGLTNLDFSGPGFGGRPSFRDLSAFLFQPQNIVANRDVLFFKADTWEHREKLRKVFPYVLDAITPDVLARQHELDQLQRELRRKERELQAVQEVSARWLAEMRASLTQARELGLLTGVLPVEPSRDQMLDSLRAVVNATDRTSRVTAATISESVQELLGLEREEGEASRTLTALRRRFSEMSRLRESVGEYRQALQIQRDRLSVADWLAGQHTGEEACPVCGGDFDLSVKTLTELQGALREIETTAGGVESIPAAFDREYERVRNDMREGSERLEAIRIRRVALEQVSSAARDRQYAVAEVQRFVGNLEKSLQLYERIGENSGLAAEVAQLQQRVSRLQTEINPADIRRRQRRALDRVRANMTRLLPGLDVERPEDEVNLDPENLTVRVRGARRDDYLWEIGSGSNWLAYHLAVTLALQQFFLSLRSSPVPGFLIYDQPSQVYFPRQVAVRAGEVPVEPDWEGRDDDVEAVQKALRVMAEAVAASRGRLQIIVLDHAPPALWQDIAGVELVEEWRGRRKLVPLEWLPENEV